MISKRWFAATLFLALATLPARGQEPKVGDYYTDDTDLGFKVRVPQKWDPIPPSPDDGNLIIKYDPRTNKAVQIGKAETMDLHVWILKFDRRKNAEADASGPKQYVERAKDFAEWLKLRQLKGFDEVSKKDSQISKVPVSERVYKNKTLSKDGEEVRLYAATFQVQPEVDVALVGWGPGDPKRWSKFESAFKEMARSFKTVEVKVGRSVIAAGASLRDKKRAELVNYVSRTPGWKLSETQNYFVLSSTDDRAFVDEIRGRLEAIRAVYEVDYPAAKAKEIREAAARAKTGKPEASGDAPEAPDGEPEEEDEPEVDPADSMELSRCSVVRVCKSREEYMSYGAPPGSGGYWDSNSRELVLYDDKAVRGRALTWLVLNHEAFHQYIYYFYGNINPHSWYNEGTGDFYSGYIYKNGRFTLEKNLERRDEIKEAIQAEKYAPLKDLMRWNQKEYYGIGKEPDVGLQNYAQGWSLIYFLRTGKKNNAKGWDPKWDNLLEDYLRVLASTGKPKQAIEQCLAGIDVDALEAAWLEYSK